MPIDELSQTYLTSVVENIPSPLQFLKRSLYPTELPVTTETIRVETIVGTQEIAPFVRKNGEAILVAGNGGTSYEVQAPNIRIKHPFTPSELLVGRQPGGVVFSPTADQKQSDIDTLIARDLQKLEQMVVNAEEYMVAMSLQGQIQYQVADQEVFQITYPRPSNCNITMTTFLDDATPANVRILTGLLEPVKKAAADNLVPNITDSVWGAEADNALLRLIESGAVKMLNTVDGGNLSVGQMTFLSQYDADGVIYRGTIGGVRIWSYPRTATLNGTTINMIRPKYVEFYSTSPLSDRTMFYGAIPDMKALRGKLFVGRRFSKSWEQEDPSVLYGLLASRPLPVPRKPAATISVKVVSG